MTRACAHCSAVRVVLLYMQGTPHWRPNKPPITPDHYICVPCWTEWSNR